MSIQMVHETRACNSQRRSLQRTTASGGRVSSRASLYASDYLNRKWFFSGMARSNWSEFEPTYSIQSRLRLVA
ncbi:hypothetical protein Hypma_016539 [Hypsizygus marmoreus]|uniref:Uncharacterized protein n=1 Tax=Hypsizygus marmoreus TaxID=39966 RepID=A0A369J0H1_HYPMA|nr:hypothetical protein Hypma_016539 [Hypsizygus marmoreus]